LLVVVKLVQCLCCFLGFCVVDCEYWVVGL